MTSTITPKILRLPEVVAITRISKATIYRLLNRNGFPRPIKLGERCVGWHMDEVESWLESRERAGSDYVASAIGESSSRNSLRTEWFPRQLQSVSGATRSL